MAIPLRTRLTLWYLVVLALVVAVFAAFTYIWSIRALNADMDSRLEEMARNFTSALSAENEDSADNKSEKKAIIETTNEMRFGDYQFTVYSPNGIRIATTANLEFPLSAEQTRAFSDVTINGEAHRVYRSTLTLGKQHYTLLVFHSLKEQEILKDRFAGVFFVGIPLALILAGIGGYFLARKSLSPVAKMGEQAKQIGATNLHERLSIRNEDDELGKLATVFNDLLARLEDSFNQQRRFMADASHELRTPLAIIRGESEVALNNANRPVTDYTESLSIVNDESKRLTKIVEDLFTLARADAKQFRTEMSEIYLDDIVGDCVVAVRSLAEKKDITIELIISGEMPMHGDPRLLHRLFLNLFDNAIKYNKIGGTVKVGCETFADKFRVEISDTGCGIPPDEQKNIFDRFYRVDKARSRTQETETSGAGLGLSIAQWIAELHQGRIDLIDSSETGSVFRVEFQR
jgi:Signal transduction histidine kinase